MEFNRIFDVNGSVYRNGFGLIQWSCWIIDEMKMGPGSFLTMVLVATLVIQSVIIEHLWKLQAVGAYHRVTYKAEEKRIGAWFRWQKISLWSRATIHVTALDGWQPRRQNAVHRDWSRLHSKSSLPWSFTMHKSIDGKVVISLLPNRIEFGIRKHANFSTHAIPN